MLRPLILATALLLAACQANPPVPAARGKADTASDARGRGLLRGEILLPPGAQASAGSRLRLALMERFSANGVVLAHSETTVEDAPPYRFELPFQREAVHDISVYRLEVALFDAAGRLRYASDGEHPVNLGEEAEPTRVVLMAIDDVAMDTRGLDCGEFVAELQFADPDLVLAIGATTHRLRRAHAAVGRRYSGADAELWMDGNRARLQLGERPIDCTPLR